MALLTTTSQNRETSTVTVFSRAQKGHVGRNAGENSVRSH